MDLHAAYGAHLKEIESRYAALLAKEGLDRLTVHSGTPMMRTIFDDQYWALRTNPHFQHWVPLGEADCAIVFEPGKKTQLIWHRTTSYWEQPAEPETKDFLDYFAVTEVGQAEDVKKYLPTNGQSLFLGEDAKTAALWGFDLARVEALTPALDQTRVIKTDYEIECLAEANRRAALGHHALIDAFRASGANSDQAANAPMELDLHLMYLRATSQDDPETPYKNIVALGKNAAVLHHVSYGRTKAGPPGNAVLLVDAGANFRGYGSDVTRTWVNEQATHPNQQAKESKEATSRFAGLIRGMERLQQKLCAQVTPGRKYEELHDASHREVAALLRESGILKSSIDEALDREVTKAFYPHGLGHSLGLQTHDVGCALIKPHPSNPFLRNTSTVAKGQCFTIEPGLYFIPRLLGGLREGTQASAIDWKLVDELTPFGGIRIEDDVVVTGDDGQVGGIRNLTREALNPNLGSS